MILGLRELALVLTVRRILALWAVMEFPVGVGVGADAETPSIPTLLEMGGGERRWREREKAVV